MHLYALRRVIAAGPGRGCWRLQFRSDVETQIQHPHIRLRSLNAESRGVALCFDTSSVQLSIGPRLFLPSGPEQCSTLLSVCLISVHPPNKGPCPRVPYQLCSHSSTPSLLIFLSFAPHCAVRVGVWRFNIARLHCSIEQ